eukprot:scaffold2658_cov246-Pinguiococcus_pyrenoidosus.AAC.4
MEGSSQPSSGQNWDRMTTSFFLATNGRRRLEVLPPFHDPAVPNAACSPTLAPWHQGTKAEAVIAAC